MIGKCSTRNVRNRTQPVAMAAARLQEPAMQTRARLTLELCSASAMSLATTPARRHHGLSAAMRRQRMQGAVLPDAVHT